MAERSGMKIIPLPNGRSRIEFEDGHVGEGLLETSRTGMTFTGVFVCGPHGPNGEHLPEVKIVE